MADGQGSDGFIVGPAFDLVFFLGAPLWALGLGWFFSWDPPLMGPAGALPDHAGPAALVAATFFAGHQWLVVARSHGRRAFFDRYRWRFAVLPALLLAALTASRWVVAACTVLAVWWEVYHASMQTFGMARIYDRRRGNDPAVGRRMDQVLNLLLYAGPLLGGAAMFDHVVVFDLFEPLGPRALAHIPYFALGYAHLMTRAWIVLGVSFLAWYALSTWWQWTQGRELSWQKLLLLLSTGACALWAWGFHGFGQAFLIMGTFHAVQYVALMWWTEREHLAERFGLGAVNRGPDLAFGLVALGCLGAGYAVLSLSWSPLAVHIGLVVALMHCLYNGLVWSVREGAV